MKEKERRVPDRAGWLLIDKPAGMSSGQVVSRIKRLLGVKRVGHHGTLDPFATGLLLLAVGPATRLFPYVRDEPKVYQFTLRWGTETDTEDLTGAVTAQSDRVPSPSEIQTALPAFLGAVLQVPPRFSALKVEGKRAYKLARQGVAFEPKPRRVQIDAFTLQGWRDNEADFEVVCGRGTYVRSLGRDLARSLGVCGHLSALRRTQAGSFKVMDAFLLDSLAKIAHDNSDFWSLIGHPRALLDDIPALEVCENQAQKLACGMPIPGGSLEEGALKVCLLNGLFLALARVKEGALWPQVVFPK